MIYQLEITPIPNIEAPYMPDGFTPLFDGKTTDSLYQTLVKEFGFYDNSVSWGTVQHPMIIIETHKECEAYELKDWLCATKPIKPIIEKDEGRLRISKKRRIEQTILEEPPFTKTGGLTIRRSLITTTVL